MELRWPGAYGVVKKRRRSDGAATPYSKRLAVALSSTGIVGAAPGGYGISRHPLSPWPEALSTGVSRGRFDQDDHEVGAMAIAPLTDITHVWDPLPAHAALPPGLCRGRFDLVADALARFTDITHFFYVAWGWDPRLTHAAPRGANYTLLCNIPNCPKRFQVLVLDPFEPFGRIQLTLQRGSKTRPGSPVAWAGFRDLSDAELVGEHALWAALREGLNCSNRIIYRWLVLATGYLGKPALQARSGQGDWIVHRYSGSLFMYADHRGGAYAKNSFGNIYAAVGVFVLDHLFREAWGSKPPKMQPEFTGFLEVSCTGDSHLGPSLREICAANRSYEKQQMEALLENVGSSICPDHCYWFGNSGLEALSQNTDRLLATHFLQARPTDYATKKLQACIKLGDSMGLCTLLVSGYLQTPSLVVNQLIVHAFVPDPLNQEPSLVENIPDPLAGEQAPETFFTASDQNSLDKTVSRYRMVRSLHNMSTSGRQIQILALLLFIFSFFTPFVHAESGIHTCPRYSIADVLPRTTCPVVKLIGAHWLHSKRIHRDLKDRHIVYPYPFTFYLESNCTKCTLLQDFFLVIGILLLWPVLMNLNERKQVNIFSFDRHLISVWIEITVSCILYCACWIIYGNLISSSEDDEISHFGSHIYSINCIACFSYLLWLVVLLLLVWKGLAVHFLPLAGIVLPYDTIVHFER